MALSSNLLSSLIKTNMEATGAKGANVQVFCDAIANGIIMSVIGATFVTLDVGLVAGIGTGTGLGITGLVSDLMKSTALSLMSSQGKNAEKLMKAIMDATVLHLSTATVLSSMDTPVFLGTGTIVVGSFSIVPSVMSNNIDSQLESSGAKGKNRTNLATAIGTAIANGILSSGTGTLVITGSPTVPTPVPGTGSGTGTIS